MCIFTTSSLSTGEGTGNPLQYSCLENPRIEEPGGLQLVHGIARVGHDLVLSFFIHSSVDRYLDCFHVLAIVNSATMNLGVCVSFRIIVLSGYMPRSGILGSYSNCL